jgi:hypothetical protein
LDQRTRQRGLAKSVDQLAVGDHQHQAA